jgi:flagellin-specific chaperone FliS
MSQGGDIAIRLKEQYQYWMVSLLRFNMEGDLSLLEAVEAQVKTVRSGWEEIKKSSLRPAHA